MLLEREREARRACQMQLARSSLKLAADGSALVRCELVCALAQFVGAQRPEFVKLAAERAEEESGALQGAPQRSQSHGSLQSMMAQVCFFECFLLMKHVLIALIFYLSLSRP